MKKRAAKDSGKVPAPKTATRRQEVPEEALGLVHNPDAWIDAEWSSGAVRTDTHGVAFPDEILRILARQYVPATIIETVLSYVEQWGRPQKHIHGLGYAIRLRDSKRHPTRTEQRLMDEISNEMYYCGVLRNEDDRYLREKLPTLLRKTGYDSMVLDRSFTEFVPDALGRPAWMRALDGATARWGRDRTTHERWPVQIHGTAITPRVEWRPGANDGHRARIGIRRARSIITSNDYGYPELEEGVQVLSGIVKASDHNLRYFQSGISSAGILALAGNTPRPQLRALKDFLESQTHGAQNNRKLAVMTYPQGMKPEFIPFANSNMREMEFSNFLNWLFKFFCAFFRIDPSLIGFMFGNEGQTSSLSEQSPDARIKLGKEKGIWSIVRHLFDGIDDYYVRPKWPEFEIIPGGLQDETEEERNKRDSERLDFMSVNEIRAERDLKPMDLSDVKNPADVPKSLLQSWIQSRAAAGGGDPGEEGGQGDDGAQLEPGSDGDDNGDNDDSGEPFDIGAMLGAGGGGKKSAKSGDRGNPGKVKKPNPDDSGEEFLKSLTRFLRADVGR